MPTPTAAPLTTAIDHVRRRSEELADGIRRAGDLTGHGPVAAFDRFLDLATAAVTQLHAGALGWEPTLGGWAPARSAFVAGVALLLAETVPPSYLDVIGRMYEVLGAANRTAFAQYFTPWPAALAMARLALADLDLDVYTPAAPLRIGDPACGSGRLLLAYAAALPPAFVAASRVRLVGADVDPVCVRMAQLNFALYNLVG